MKTLAIDIETYSETDLKKCGAYKYAQDPAHGILWLGYSVDEGPANRIPMDDTGAMVLPRHIMDALVDPTVLKTAYNAAFERSQLSAYYQMVLPPEQWSCTMVLAAAAGLPLGLGEVASALGLEQQKYAEGRALIKYFCGPCKPSKANGMRTRNLPHHDPEKWEAFGLYCQQDVTVELAIRKAIQHYELTETEKKLWALDQQINDRGIQLDRAFIENAMQIDLVNSTALTAEAARLTGLDNPNSAAQLRKWLEDAMFDEVGTLRKADVVDLIAKTDDPEILRALRIRQELAKTSNKKYATMMGYIMADDRARGLLQFYGASRTGRWAGRGIQVQNLPGSKLDPDDSGFNLDLARQLVAAGDMDTLAMCFDNIPDTLSYLIRTAFVARPGHKLIVSDLSAIEARILAWLAGEQWRLEVFKTHGKIYEASAAAMFGIPIETIKKGPIRQKGKVAELALGYQGGPDALITMGALAMGLTEEELEPLVKAWRKANPAIVSYWKVIDAAAKEAVRHHKLVETPYGIKFFVDKGTLFIQLPSGRRLSYLKPTVEIGRGRKKVKITEGVQAVIDSNFEGIRAVIHKDTILFDYGYPVHNYIYVPDTKTLYESFETEQVCYMGLDQVTRQWKKTSTYGGKLVENIVQAVARDVLAVGIIRCEANYLPVVLHVHDEIASEVEDIPENGDAVQRMEKLMSDPIQWAPGLPLAADGFENFYYKK